MTPKTLRPLLDTYHPATGHTLAARFDFGDDPEVRGDGTTDATTAIQTMLTAHPAGEFYLSDDTTEIAAPIPGQQRRSYLITDTIEIGPDQTLAMHPNAELVYAGPNDRPALRFRGQTTKKSEAISVRRQTTEWDTTDTTSVGIEFVNCARSTYDIAHTSGFETGLLLHGDTVTATGGASGSTSYNTFNLGLIIGNKRNVRFAVTGAGAHANSNNFYGGQLRHNSTPNAGTNSSGQLVPVAGTREIDLSVTGNGNNFHGVAMEGGAVEETIEVAKSFNTFTGCRWEVDNHAGGLIHFLPGSSGNTVIGGYHLWGHNGHRAPGLPEDVMHVLDEGSNVVMGSRGIRSYIDGTFGRGDVGAFTAQGTQTNATNAFALAGLDKDGVVTAAVKSGYQGAALFNPAEVHLLGLDGVVHVVDFSRSGVLRVDGSAVGGLGAGSTSERPVLAQGHVGAGPYFDTTEGKPVWFTGSGWVDASGSCC